jgi:hypothetical protein
MENQNIPTNWKTTVMQGVLYWWCEPVEESAVTQSIAKNSMVESYLKCQCAWEKVTEILPRETEEQCN